MRLENHRIDGVEFVPARLVGGEITPKIVILHDTASRLDKYNARDYLASSLRASAHFVVELDGTITQLVPTNRRAGHAGQSVWQNEAECNDFSIGIEMVSPGRLTRVSESVGLGGGESRAITWFGQLMSIKADQLVEMTTPEHGWGFWMPYPQAQIDAVIELLEALFAGIHSLKDITTHWYVSPGRKIDPAPIFPVDAVRARVLGPDDPALTAAAEGSKAEIGSDFVRVIAAPTLNLRRWPSFNPNVLTSIPAGTVVPVLRRGSFAGNGWIYTRFGGHEGWALARYTTPLAL